MKPTICALFFASLVAFSATIPVNAGAPNMFVKVSDFDGDGRADFAITRNEGGLKIWYIWQTSAGFRVAHWGIDTDVAAAGDYDGDGRTDLAVYRDSTNFPIEYSYHIRESGTGFYVKKLFSAFANFGAFPAHQDYNGDGRVDAALNYGEFGFATQFTIQYSGGGGLGSSVPARSLTARMGDLDGDGRSDLAHYNLDTYILSVTNLNTNTTRNFQFGISGDRYLMADFDGDSVGDLAIYRPSTGTWWWVRSSDGQPRAYRWGTSTDIPVPADYDGDGKTDIAIWRPGTQSAFWVVGSQSGTFVIPWGISADRPVGF